MPQAPRDLQVSVFFTTIRDPSLISFDYDISFADAEADRLLQIGNSELDNDGRGAGLARYSVNW